MNFARTIKQLREKAKMTQQELANASNFKSFTSISQFETGNAIPRFDAIVRISAALNISPIEFYLLSCEVEDLYSISPSRRTSIRNIVNKLSSQTVTEELIKSVINE